MTISALVLGAKVKALETHWRGEFTAALWKPEIQRPDAG
jgi:hypothetical protein